MGWHPLPRIRHFGTTPAHYDDPFLIDRLTATLIFHLENEIVCHSMQNRPQRLTSNAETGQQMALPSMPWLLGECFGVSPAHSKAISATSRRLQDYSSQLISQCINLEQDNRRHSKREGPIRAKRLAPLLNKRREAGKSLPFFLFLLLWPDWSAHKTGHTDEETGLCAMVEETRRTWSLASIIKLAGLRRGWTRQVSERNQR